MKNKEKKSTLSQIALFLLSITLWLFIWELAARIFDFEIIFPGPIKTLDTLLSLIITLDFWKTVYLSIIRIALGLIIGVALGVVLALICRLAPMLYSFVSIGITVIKSTPVASIVLILWVIIGSANLPTLIGVLMVAPIIWQNLIDAYNSIDVHLLEVADVFGFTRKKRFAIIVFPALLKYFVPAILTSIGLAWKSGIAAEIIAYTKTSIGKNIVDAKAYLEGDVMMAWTVVVIALSLLFEFIVKLLLRRFTHEIA